MHRLSHKYKGVPVFYSATPHRLTNKRTEVVAEARYGRIIVYKKEALHKVDVLEHEYMHIQQMRRDGLLVYKIRMAFFNIFRGYNKNPYEIEAHRAGHQAKVASQGAILATK